MSLSYGSLSPWYDALTNDVPYSSFAAYYRNAFSLDGGQFSLLLDLCCGTGTLTCLLAHEGYDMIGTDASPDMLSVAAQKAAAEGVSPLFLCQRAEELDLYGTVDAAVSSLDSINYIPCALLPVVLERLRLFIRPGGLFIFDIRSVEWLKQLDCSTSVDEDADMLCLWRADYDREENCIVYGIDLFTRTGRLWKREREEHVEYAYTEEELRKMLDQAHFSVLRVDRTGPQGELGRVFFVCRRNF